MNKIHIHPPLKSSPSAVDATHAKLDERKQFLRRVNEAVDSALANGPVNVADIALQMHLTMQSFRRRLLKYAGMTPKAYITDLQMKKAVKLLLGSANPPVMKIALMCGFENSSSFCHKFRRVFGCAPLQYRARILSPDDALSNN